MSRKSKKQPYRNALLKLKKERASLDSLYKENLRLNANALYKQQEAHDLLNSAAQDKERAEKLRNEVLKELKQYNPYHPALHNNIVVENIIITDALRYRISAPYINWDDNLHSGSVRIVCHKQPNQYETLSFGFTESFIEERVIYRSDELIDDISKTITKELMTLANTKMKEW